MKLAASPGAQFYNANCYFLPECFILTVSNQAGAATNDVVTLDGTTEPPNKAILSSNTGDNGEIFYLTPSGVLVDATIGSSAIQVVPSGETDPKIFLSQQTTAKTAQNPICTLGSGPDFVFSCTASAGSSLYGCTNLDATPGGIALVDDITQVAADGICTPITLNWA